MIIFISLTIIDRVEGVKVGGTEKRYASLFSGGKDSTFALYKALQDNKNVEKLITMVGKEQSYMYHLPNIHLTELQAESIGIPLFKAKAHNGKEKEIKDLKNVVRELDVDGLIAGAVESEYQQERIDKLCKDLDLELYNPLWKKDPRDLLQEIIKADFKVIISGLAAYGFDKTYLGKKLNYDLLEDLKELNKEYKVHIAGEGGEFETTVLDGPIFNKKVKILESKRKWDKTNYRGSFQVRDAKLIEKK